MNPTFEEAIQCAERASRTADESEMHYATILMLAAIVFEVKRIADHLEQIVIDGQHINFNDVSRELRG